MHVNGHSPMIGETQMIGEIKLADDIYRDIVETIAHCDDIYRHETRRVLGDLSRYFLVSWGRHWETTW